MQGAESEAAAGLYQVLHHNRRGLCLGEYGPHALQRHGLRPGQLAHNQALLLACEDSLWHSAGRKQMEGREPGGLGRHSGFARGWYVVQQGRLAGGSHWPVALVVCGAAGGRQGCGWGARCLRDALHGGWH